MSDPSIAVDVAGLRYAYGERVAVSDVTFQVGCGEIFAFLGPNGGGKSTLFRVLSTLVPLQQGKVSILGHDLVKQRRAVQLAIGVVFQSPSLDKNLSVAENIRHQAALYGIRGRAFREHQQTLLRQLGLEQRIHERAATLSGGLRRRVELAKGMIHHPRLLLMDEPSTGLDPGARSDLWQYLEMLRDEVGMTILLTTHLLEEADRVDRIAILNEGKIVALDTPTRLRESVGGDSITITASSGAQGLSDRLKATWELDPRIVEGRVRLELEDGERWIPRIMQQFPGEISAITLGKPTLEDVFIKRTGHRFHAADVAAEENSRRRSSKGRRRQ